MNTRLRGMTGEDQAVQFLQKQGYKILERNYRACTGEIDIIAQDKDVFCFIEVKARRKGALDSAWEAVTRAKQRKISQVALSYLKQTNRTHVSARFDVVAVCEDACGQEHIELVQDAFELASPYGY